MIPDEAFGWLTWRGTWGQIDELLGQLRESGAAWVNLRFALESDGTALVGYEAKPSGVPFEDRRAPGVTGGFDCHRLMSPAEFRHLHP